MTQPLADEDRDVADVPVSGWQLTSAGRAALAAGTFQPHLAATPGFDPALALDLLFAAACWQDRYTAAGRRL